MHETDQAIATPLSPDQCVALAESIAADPASWERCVQHIPGRRHYERLSRDDDREIYVISWMDDHDTGFHDHDISCGAVHVVAGGIFEERLSFDGPHVERLVSPGETIRFAASYIHRFRPHNGIPTVTIHVYSPPLQTMGAYYEGPDGALIRTPISGEAELVNLNV